MKKLIIAIVLIVAALAWSAGTYTTDDLVANDDITAGGTVQGEHLYSTDDIVADDDITAAGTVQGEHLYSTDDAIVDDDANIGDELQVWGRALIGRDTLPLVAGPNCLGYWKMNDNAASTTVLDFLGMHNGTASENTDDLNGTGKIDGALQMGDNAPISNARIVVVVASSDTTFNVTDELAIAFWFKSNIAQNNNHFIAIQEDTGFDEPYRSYIVNNGGSILFSVRHASGYTIVTTTNRGVGYWLDGDWHLAILTFDKDLSVLTTRHEVYIDNVLEGSGASYTEDIVAPPSGYNDVHIGHQDDGAVWDGWLDEVIIFNKALSSDDRDGLWNSGSGQEYAENFNVYDNLNVIGGLAIIYPDHVTDVHDDLFIEGALEVYGSAYVETNLSVDGDITDVDDLTASGTITATNLAIDHIAEKTSAHNVVFDNDVNLGANDLTTTGTGTFNNLKIEGAIPILIFKDNTDTGDSARGFQEWRDSDNVRLGFFGNSSYTHDDLVWKNESSGGHLLLETTGIGIVSSNTDFTTTGAITGSYVNITDEPNGYQVDGIRALSIKGTSPNENILLGQAGNFTMTGIQNLLAGYLVGSSLTSGGSNCFYGFGAGNSNTSGNGNVFVGAGAGASNVLGDDSVFIGSDAGSYETASNKLFIDNQARADEADGRIKALIYGVFDAAVANQSLVFNTGSITTPGTLGAGAITGTSFIIGGNTLDTSEWAFLDGQDQALPTTSSPNFADSLRLTNVGGDTALEFVDSLANYNSFRLFHDTSANNFEVQTYFSASWVPIFRIDNKGNLIVNPNKFEGGGKITQNMKGVSGAGLTEIFSSGLDLGDGVGQVGDGLSYLFRIENSGGAQHDAAKWIVKWTDPTADSEDSAMVFQNMVAGSFVDVLTLDGDALNVIGNTTLGDASTDLITCTGRWIPRTVAADPTANATAGSLGEIVFFSDKWYGKTVADGTDTNWAALN